MQTSRTDMWSMYPLENSMPARSCCRKSCSRMSSLRSRSCARSACTPSHSSAMPAMTPYPKTRRSFRRIISTANAAVKKKSGFLRSRWKSWMTGNCCFTMTVAVRRIRNIRAPTSTSVLFRRKVRSGLTLMSCSRAKTRTCCRKRSRLPVGSRVFAASIW